MKRALVIANGEWVGDREYYNKLLSEVDTLVCADGGAEFARRLGIQPERIFGDFDSLSPELKGEYQELGIEFVTFPVEKDKTDTHLVIDYLIKEGFDEVLLAGAMGGRPDHQFGNLMLLSYGYQRGINVKLISPTVEIMVMSGRLEITGHLGDTFSLIPIDKVATGVTLEGFKYPLHKHDVYRESTLGVSNLITSDNALVYVEEGRVFIFVISQEIV